MKSAERFIDNENYNDTKKKAKLVEPARTDLLNRPAWKPPELMIRDGGLEYKNWKSKGGD